MSPWSIVETVIIRKDIISVWSNGGIRLLLILLPIILVLIVPVTFLVAISLMPVGAGESVPEGILNMLPEDVANLNYKAAMFAAFTNMLAPMFYLSVPIISSVAISSMSIVHEKEEHTLETLMLTSVSAKSIFNAKIVASTLLSLAISLLSFILFSITAIVGSSIVSAPLFFNFDWFVIIILLTPAITVFCTVFVSLMSSRVKSVGESLQIMGYFILIVASLFLMQFCGLFNITAVTLLIISLILIIADFVLYNTAMKKFTPDKMLTTSFLETNKIKD